VEIACGLDRDLKISGKVRKEKKRSDSMQNRRPVRLEYLL